MTNIRLLKADEIDVRIGGFNKAKTGGFLLLYKDARVDMAILDETFGVYGWQRKHELINNNLFCTISIYDKETKQWIDKQDVGVESNNDKTKGQASDSFKRAGFNVGIGRELYTAPFIWIKGLEKFDKFKVKEIGYNENREINRLIITDDKGNTKYTLGGRANASNAKKKSTNNQGDKTSNRASTKQIELITNLAKRKNYELEKITKYIKKEFEKNNSKELTKKEASKLIEMLNRLGK